MKWPKLLYRHPIPRQVLRALAIFAGQVPGIRAVEAP